MGTKSSQSSFTDSCLCVTPCCLQILPVSPQVRPVCAHPQGDPHRLPLHQPSQGQEEQADGYGRVVAGPQPQQLLHQLRQLCGLLRQRTTQPSWTGEMLHRLFTVEDHFGYFCFDCLFFSLHFQEVLNYVRKRTEEKKNNEKRHRWGNLNVQRLEISQYDVYILRNKFFNIIKHKAISVSCNIFFTGNIITTLC